MFLPVRQPALGCRPCSLRIAVPRAISSSAVRGARRRPPAHGHGQENSGSDARRDSRDDSVRSPRASFQLEHASLSMPKAVGPGAADRRSVRAASAVAIEARPTLAAKGAESPQTSVGKLPLVSYSSIRQGPGLPLTTVVTAEEEQRLAAAQRFFEHSCDFLYSAEALRHHRRNEQIPELVVMGASNVGKSSFLNALVGKPGSAKVGRRPGKTKLMNVFGVGPRPHIPPSLLPAGSAPPQHSLNLVDTPGYGFGSQATWGAEILKYLESRQRLRGAVVLMSLVKRKPSADDLWMLRVLAELNMRTLVVVTKADQPRPAEWPSACSRMADAVLGEMQSLDDTVCGRRWRAAGAGAESDVYVTAAGMSVEGRLGNRAGMGGVRAAMLQMAGFDVRAQVTKTADNVVYAGPTVSFDDIRWTG